MMSFSITLNLRIRIGYNKMGDALEAIQLIGLVKLSYIFQDDAKSYSKSIQGNE